MSDSELHLFALFEGRPSDEFLDDWRRDIEQTGEPEKFRNVSTARPGDSEDLHLLSPDIRVPIALRSEGGMVPCPLCSPKSPKFVIGRMAWFPRDKAVRFIGRDCAAKHFQEDYQKAETRFRTEETAKLVQEIWPTLQANVHWLVAGATKMHPVIKALQDCRDGFGWHPQDFAAFFYRNQPRTRTLQGAKQKFQTDDVVGMEFLAPDFKPLDELLEIRACLEDIKRSLPPWKPQDGANAAAQEIADRGKVAQRAIKRLPRLLTEVRDAREFLTLKNLRNIGTWFKSGASAFATLSMNVDGHTMRVNATSYERSYTFQVEMPSILDAALPAKADVAYKLARTIGSA